MKNPYDFDWRQVARSQLKEEVSPRMDAVQWAAAKLFQATELSRRGEGARAATIMDVVKSVMIHATPLDLIEVALEQASRHRPPRDDEHRSEGRYASLTITALEEARNWEVNRRDSI